MDDFNFKNFSYLKQYQSIFGDILYSNSIALPLSIGQYDIWLEQRLYPSDFSNNIHFVAKIHENVNLKAFQQAIWQLAERHEVIRTIFPILKGIPIRRLESEKEVKLRIDKCHSLSENEIKQLIIKNYSQPFDLLSEVPYKFYLYQKSSSEYYFQIIGHHIAYALGFTRLPAELVDLYISELNGNKQNLPIKQATYSSFIQGQYESLKSGELKASKDFWQNYLSGDLPEPLLPLNPCNLNPSQFMRNVYHYNLDNTLVSILKKISHSLDVTFFSLITSAFQVLLNRYTKQDETIVGIPCDERRNIIDEKKFQDLIGYTTNTLPLRCKISLEQDFSKFAKNIYNNIQNISKHRSYPLAMIRDDLGGGKGNKSFEFFKILIASQKCKDHKEVFSFGVGKKDVSMDVKGLKYESIGIGYLPTGRFDLALAIVDTSCGYVISFHYNSSIFKEKTIQRFASNYLELLQSIVSNPHQKVKDLSVVSEEERFLQLEAWSGESTDLEQKESFIEKFEKTVFATPDSTALIFEGNKINYRYLNNKANQFAHYLKKLGAAKETLIGVCLERSIEQVISLLGILKAGSAYLPIDIKHPKERIQYMLDDSQADILITQDAELEKLQGFKGRIVVLERDRERIFNGEIGNPITTLHPNQLAYVIYTSGSTGKPKGVEICQKSLTSLLISVQEELNFLASDRWLALTTISFDISILEILLPLSQGGTLVLANQETSMDPSLLAQAIKKNKITFAQATPSTWQVLVDFGWKGDQKLKIICGGESLSQSLGMKLAGFVCTLWNMYGPTETTIYSTLKKVDSSNKKITIGRPLKNTITYILDENQKILPIGALGELFIGGEGVARGYRQKIKLTEERFISSPFSHKHGSKLYRTGDLARYLPNGEIEYLGRVDHQVKIRGYRIELGEIEETVKLCEGVKQAAVIVKKDVDSDNRIIVYFTGSVNKNEIKQFLELYLPTYMMPSAYVHLSQFPLNSNGKIDRQALSKITCISEDVSGYVAPSNDIEIEVVKVFESLLQTKKVGKSSNFFSLGGHSLLAARAIMKINQIFCINLPLKTLFEKPTVELIAKEVAFSATSVPIPKTLSSPPFALSYSQQHFWFLDQLQENSAAYSVPFAIKFSGNLDISILQKSLDKIVQRQEILRSIFKDGPKQMILPAVNTGIQYEDLRKNKTPESDAEIFMLNESKKPFNLQTGPLFRFYLLHVRKKHFLLFLNFHHIIFDGFSISVFLNELKILYESYALNKKPLLSKLDVNYVDYLYWQKNAIEGLVSEEKMSWWQKKLNDELPVLNLPTDNPRPQLQTYNGSIHEFSIVNHDDLIALKQLAQQHETTLFIVLLAIFHLFLYRYTGQHDIVIGVPTSGRNHDSLDSLIGCFTNTLALRTQSKSKDTFHELLKCFKKETLEAFKYQDIPFEKVIEELKVERSSSYNPIFQVMFNMLPEIEVKQILNIDLDLRSLDRANTHFDLSLTVQETTKELRGVFEYNTDLFIKQTIELMASHFQNLVREVIRRPQNPIGKIQFLSDDEMYQSIVEWNKQPCTYSNDKTILQLIEKWAEVTPEATAIFFEDQRYSYYKVNTQANRIAHALLAHGLQPEEKVVICLERSADFLSGVLGILKAGGAYVPVDPMEPLERLDVKLKDLCPKLILSHSSIENRFYNFNVLYIDQLDTFNTCNPNIAVSDDQLAYIIYTSGSTGVPKGVEIEHKSINDRVLWKNAFYPLKPQDVVLHIYSFIFDGAIINYLWPLCAGASLVIASKSEQMDYSALVQLIQRYNVTTMDLLPSLLQGMLEERDFFLCHTLRNVFTGGEALSTETVRLFKDKCEAKLHNTYGPTETTVEASVWECKSNYLGPIAPIGHPIAGAKLYILDENQNIVPIGVSGELHIGGIGLARGYLNDPVLTKEKFILDPFSGSTKNKLYKTGDLVKYAHDGTIEFLGRVDSQIKIRGFRVDLREIESALLQMEAVKQAIVIPKGSKLHRRLVAYVLLTSSISEKAFYKLMNCYLDQRIPGYMVPQQVVVMKSFPTFLNGKINYKALPEPIIPEKKLSSCSEEECSSALEKQLLSIWKKVLDHNAITIKDNFFEIGGNSLLAMRLIAQIKSNTGISIPVIHVFQHPTIKALAESMKSLESSKPWSSIVVMKSTGHKTPFFCVHPVGGNVLCYNALSKHWPSDRPLYAIQALGLEKNQIPHESIEAMAREYIRDLKKVQSAGPYFLGGWSFGGLIAAEMVHQLQKQNEEVALLVLIDTTANIEKVKKFNVNDESVLLSDLAHHYLGKSLKKEKHLSLKEQFIRFIDNGGQNAINKNQDTIESLIALVKANYRALHAFSIPVINTNIALIKARKNPEKTEDLGWNKYTTRLKVFHGPGDHWAITQNSKAKYYSKLIQTCFELPYKEKQKLCPETITPSLLVDFMLPEI